MTSLSDPNTIHISQSSAFTYNVHLTQRYLQDSPDSIKLSDHHNSSIKGSCLPKKSFTSQEYELALEALGFVIGSSKIRGQDGKLMCSRVCIICPYFKEVKFVINIHLLIFSHNLLCSTHSKVHTQSHSKSP